MMDGKTLFDFMLRFDLMRPDVKVSCDGKTIWFEKPSGKKWPLEYALNEDHSYEVYIYDCKPGEDGESITLEKGQFVSSYSICILK